MSKSENGEEEIKKGDEKQQQQKKTQSQLIQEALGLTPEEVEAVEKKLFIVRFLDYFSEETFDFIYKEKSIEQFETQINKYIEEFSNRSEENVLIKESFESKDIFNLVKSTKKNAEDLALKYGRKKSVEKSMRNMNYIMIIVLIGMMSILYIPGMEGIIDMWFLLPIMCVFCMVPQILRTTALKKWFEFKEAHKNEFFKENREDLLILKNHAAEILDDVRTALLDKKVPIQLIKFVLYSRDYENIKVLNQKSVRGTTQYVLTFEYPLGMEPYPIPEALQIQQPSGAIEKKMDNSKEENFIVLTQVDAKEGVINSFIPVLKDSLADKINNLLNESQFSLAKKSLSDIIPAYSSELGIFCVCGELVKIDYVQVANWKNELNFYLFESKKCRCNEKIFALSIIDKDAQIPDELKDIFES